MSKTKKQMSEIKHKELTDEDKIRLQLIDDAISQIKPMPAIDETIKTCGNVVDSISDRGTDISANPQENVLKIENENIPVAHEQLILPEQKITK
ncbi:MAG: hypothetical protein EZS28_019743 [Streblomastix strix]|uniref:Uncharacterized protein n=1 Tax=Streblomastix strix TaxID=222440 RepID=A0A5J4VQH7_9EUKA|nr:MAG: hypothetical protein EZS28_019743 [Streblomastix strix]